jgi:hypothetical protein
MGLQKREEILGTRREVLEAELLGYKDSSLPRNPHFLLVRQSVSDLTMCSNPGSNIFGFIVKLCQFPDSSRQQP